jgi:threonine/homoserine/homoserine lactone efflux protein
MTLSGLLLFAGVYAMAVLSPGPAVAAVIANVLGAGIRRSAFFIWGIVVGDLVWFGLVGMGLAALAENFQGLFIVVKYAGVAYLLFLAYKLWTAPASVAEAASETRGGGAKLFLGGLALTMGNPKVMVFFVSILPLVVDLTKLSPIIAGEIAMLIFVILSAAMWTYAFAADRARRVVASSRAMKLINRATAGVMAGAAVAVVSRN